MTSSPTPSVASPSGRALQHAGPGEQAAFQRAQPLRPGQLEAERQDDGEPRAPIRIYPRVSPRAGLTGRAIFFPARDFPQQDILSWNNFAPRLGLIYDLKGDGHARRQGRLWPLPARGQHGIHRRPERKQPRRSRSRCGTTPTGTRSSSRERKGRFCTSSAEAPRPWTRTWGSPTPTSSSWGWTTMIFQDTRLSVNFTYRTKTNLIAFVDEGVPDSAYDLVDAIDPGRRRRHRNVRRRADQVFNMRPEFAGQNRLVETNPGGLRRRLQRYRDRRPEALQQPLAVPGLLRARQIHPGEDLDQQQRLRR